jgi:cytidylate kinase
MTRATDAIVVVTDGLSIDEVVERVLNLLEEADRAV